MMKELVSIFLFLVLLVAADSDDVIDCTKTIWGGPAGPNVDCIFPFKMSGKTFNECTIFSEKNSRPWCATKLDSNGEHSITSNDWGYCDRRCSFSDSKSVHQEATTSNPSQTVTRPPKRPTPRSRPTKASTTARPTTTSAALNLDLVQNNATLSGTWLPKSDASECGSDISSGFITGGHDAKRGQYPFAALLGYKDLKGTTSTGVIYLCGGSLINRLYVVTAAHCHDDGLPGYEVIEVVLGEHDVGEDPDCDKCVSRQTFAPKKITLHQNWTPTNRGGVPDFDIALIRLDHPATLILDDFVTPVLPVCLHPPLIPSLETKVVVVGWGQIATKKADDRNPEEEDHLARFGVGHRILQKLKVPLVTNAKCNNFFPGITKNQICAGGVQGQDSCNGDSGGGLVTDDKPMFIVGVVSSGSRICGVGEPGIYTRVEAMYPWIIQTMEP